jgi:hypothetical protein
LYCWGLIIAIFFNLFSMKLVKLHNLV